MQTTAAVWDYATTVHSRTRTPGDGHWQSRGWAVLATFARLAGSDIACVGYQVRAVRDVNDEALVSDAFAQMKRGRVSPEDVADMFPMAAGIPRYVFEQTTQTELLRQARELLEHVDAMRRKHEAAGYRSTAHVPDEMRAVLAQPDVRRRTGRPPAVPLVTKLRILRAVDEANRTGRSLERVAEEAHMSRSALRDLLRWARTETDTRPQLFTRLNHGKRGGELTAAARQMLAELEAQDGADRG